MSNRDALRKLSRKLPASPEIEKIMESLKDDTDLSIAIIASAIVEASLEKLLIQKFECKDSSLIGQIFLNKGPLTDFHSKIIIANAFGILTSPLANELHSIKSIRNAFAHSTSALSFDNELIKTEIDSLKMLGSIRGVEVDTGTNKIVLALSNRDAFLLEIRLLLILFDGITKHHGTADEALRHALR
jgi:DNA-binding MltR family transcriptional regulator